MAPSIQFKNIQSLWRTFDKVSKNGIRVVKGLDRSTGEVVTQAFKPGATTPFKQIVQSTTKRTNVPHHSHNLASLNITEKSTQITEIGKKPIDIRTNIDEWFHMGQPNKTYSRGLRVQEGVSDKSWIKNLYYGETTHKNRIALFDNTEIINFKYI